MRGYEFRKKKDTEEIHVFEGTISGVNPKGVLIGTTNETSICKGAVKAESELASSRIVTPYEARYFAAGRGDTACGVCVSHFYKTYK